LTKATIWLKYPVNSCFCQVHASFYRPIASASLITTFLFENHCSLFTVRTSYAAHEGVSCGYTEE
jgi:hypothetical protein